MGFVHRVSGRLALAFLAPLVVLCVVGVITYRNTSNLRHTSGMVSHTYQVLEGLETITSRLKDAETGQRGFLITGQEAYLDPYNAALAAISGDIDNVATLTKDNTAQQQRIGQLRPLVTAKLDELKETIDLRRDSGFDAARAVVLTDKGKAVMDQIRSLLSAMSNAESSLLSVRDSESAEASAQSHAVIAIGVLLTAILVVALGGLLARSILRPLSALTRRMREIAEGEGDLTQRVDESRRDEFGTLGVVFNQLMGKLSATMGSIAGQARGLAGAIQELTTVSTQIGTAAEQTASQATSVSAAAEQMRSTVGTLAAGAEEMGASIREISTNATEASRIVAQAVDVAGNAKTTVTQLGESSGEISNVVKLINAIAEQTNLLALNATIEAARAGEMGKGFAVVASEVKDLAQETARATDDITGRIASIQTDADAAGEAIAEMSEIVIRVNDYQTTIASAVEEQTATTAEMARNISDASATTDQIAASVGTVAAAASQTTHAVRDIQGSVSGLDGMSTGLRSAIDQFRY
ncbi:methyl-accepting chemotaxis protein [Paractinoplanes globisporus]|uniref:Methyl-accepting chemotaxis protein n=1 Tax=Paractinoplanes globisporus TaxID=113565 RepID=A0ABW6WP43_9ACTN|nr:CHASE3 domain-containing protein [Actinoplanes globisporus]